MSEPILILAEYLGEFRKAADKLARRARRAGVEEAGYELGEPVFVERSNEAGRKYTVEFIPVTIVGGAAVKVAGWTFTARVERVNGSSLIHRVPGQEGISIDEHAVARAEAGKCDHCKADRRRNDVYVVQREDGAAMSVGRTCLRDFLGTDTPENITARFRWERVFEELGGEERWGTGGEMCIASLTELLRATHVICRLWGWCSKGQSDKELARWNAQLEERGAAPTWEPATATASRLHHFFHAEVKEDRVWTEARRRIHAEMGEQDEAAVTRVIAWARDLGMHHEEYLRNLHVLIGKAEAHQGILHRHVGLVCSAVQAEARARGETFVKTEEKLPSRHVGKVGERLRGLKLKLVDVRSMSGSFGDCRLVKMQADDGALFSWFGTASLDGSSRGDRLEVTGTVKAHREYKGTPETQLTRCSVVRVRENGERA